MFWCTVNKCFRLYFVLRFDLYKRDSSAWYYAEYSSFRVHSEAHKYRLDVSGYSGNTGHDALSTHDGMMFTTYDRDNDPWTDRRYRDNCAVRNGGAFCWTLLYFVQFQISAIGYVIFNLTK